MEVIRFYETTNGKRFEDIKECIRSEIEETPAAREFEGFCFYYRDFCDYEVMKAHSDNPDIFLLASFL